MKKTPVTCLASIVSVLLVALTPPSLHAGWIRTYGGNGDAGYSVQQTTDGGYIIVGLRDRNSNICLLKTDSKGDTLWTRTYGGDGMDHGYCVQQTSEGGYIIVGFTSSFARFGSQDLWLLKTDSEGDTLWTRIYGVDGGRYDNDEGSFVQETPDGGYVILGSQNNIDGLATTFWLFKTDTSGDILWTRTYDLTTIEYWNWGYCVQQTMDGGYILTGTSNHPETVVQALALVKTDSNGDTLWTHLYWGGEAEGVGDSSAFGTCVQQTPDGGYIVGGYGFIPSGEGWQKGNMLLLKTDANGDTLWTRSYQRENLSEINSLDQTMDGGYILVGFTGGQSPSSSHYTWLVKTDEAGDTLWTRAFGEAGGNAVGHCVHQTPDGGYIHTGGLDGKLCLIKTDSLGCVSVAEEPSVRHPSNWQISASIGRQITIRYTNHPQGFHASVFDASGRKVDELHSNQPSGTIIWPVTPPVTPSTSATHQSPGVYFIRVESDKSGLAHKVVLIK